MAVVQPYTPHSDGWFEAQEPGGVHYTPSRTITDADVVLFGGMTGDLCELHTNEAYARSTEFGGRIAHGMLNLSLAHGLVTRAGHLVGTGIALLGWNNIAFRGPVRIGETVQARRTTIEKRESRSRPDAGIVIDRVELLTQDGVVAVSGEVTTLVRKRPV
ncbi:MaoC family dehydratase [Mesorhizobium sp. L-8-10]|uniref:MaoC family dehydratase n=1 Tax=Mesorhizobium sp. L-8-10 TaxID=2744523 RepID=UPI0019280AE6|nr:MaoC/PaaZ C-terminal domain-containing protein [Mesorhizobium sp. L-8-10]BCH31265.1 MaoC family dehydratase [Mesorhizobium sp. L-8-10]